jgi:hypothetical protein
MYFIESEINPSTLTIKQNNSFKTILYCSTLIENG